MYIEITDAKEERSVWRDLNIHFFNGSRQKKEQKSYWFFPDGNGVPVIPFNTILTLYYSGQN